MERVNEDVVVPDPLWVWTDPAGHVHRWVERLDPDRPAGAAPLYDLPSTRDVVALVWWCGTCSEEHVAWERQCITCQAPVNPGMVPAPAVTI